MRSLSTSLTLSLPPTHRLMHAGAEGFTSEGDQEEVRKIERQLKNRFPIGSHVSEQRIIQDFLKQVLYSRQLGIS